MPWHQHEIRLPPLPRGFHLVTREVEKAVPELAGIRIGLLHAFVCHTSASLSINENADPDVPRDLEMAFSAIAREDLPYAHTVEGPDDMPAHIKMALTRTSESVPVEGGRMLLGTWQGIFLWEHRSGPHRREVVVTVMGEVS
mgnify:CR=1 FL=1